MFTQTTVAFFLGRTRTQTYSYSLQFPISFADTMHRSKGNLAAIELRRCRNKLIVGATTNTNANKKVHGVSSRGSSGIGSDLAPSPEERQEGQSSSGLCSFSFSKLYFLCDF